MKYLEYFTVLLSNREKYFQIYIYIHTWKKYDKNLRVDSTRLKNTGRKKNKLFYSHNRL